MLVSAAAGAVAGLLTGGITAAFAPAHVAVTRWGGALPQYQPGHLARVDRLRHGLPGTIALAGAAFDGVGIPACVRSGENAADQLIGALA